MLTDLATNPACVECGLCREACPVFSVERRETVSPRGRAALAVNEVRAASFYQCTLCRACRLVCPVGRDPAGEQLRAGLVAAGVETEANRQMIANIRRYGNAFGPLRDGEVPKTLTCC